MANKLDRIDYPILELPSGDNLFLTIFRVKGSSPGPHVHIQANVHGAEIQGNAVIWELINYFINNEFKGSITFIPTANPLALNSKSGTYTTGRFSQVTGDNWNRMYQDIFSATNGDSSLLLNDFVNSNLKGQWHEIKSGFKQLLFQSCKKLEKDLILRNISGTKVLALLLQKIASSADIVLDLHTGPKATHYIYSAEHQKESVKNFHFPFIINIPARFEGAMDEATFTPWVQLQKAFKNHGRNIPIDFESFTIELGNEEQISFKNAEKYSKHILNYLKAKKIINNLDQEIDVNANQVHATLENFKTYYAPSGGLYEFKKSPGEFVRQGEALATYLNFKTVKDESQIKEALKEVTALKDCYIINHSPTGSIIQGMELYQVIENYESNTLGNDS